MDPGLVAIAGLSLHPKMPSPEMGTRLFTNMHFRSEEGHISKECDKPRNLDTVTCRNCEEGEGNRLNE